MLDASGVDPSCIVGVSELISLVRAKELAQAAIAAAAAERAEQRPRVPEGGDAVVISVPEEGDRQQGLLPLP